MHKGRGPSQGYSCPALLAADPTTSDIKEFFGMYRDDDMERPNQWLDDPASVNMRRDLVAFYESCRLVILELLSALADEVGLASNYLHSFVSDANHFIACLHYPATSEESFTHRVRSAAHTDYGCMTLLFNDSGKGLQVMRHGQYEYVPRVHDCAVVNSKWLLLRETPLLGLTIIVGDLLSRFFNGVLPSTMHRVIEPPALSRTAGQQIPDRYSLAFFGHFDADLVVKPLDALCSASRPAQFKPVLAGEHVKARVRQLHVAGHSLRDSSTKIDHHHVATLEVSAS
jgi:isopenicillin N synthase-like dioxygenase